MHGVYLLSVWLHIMAAIIWIGGMIFLVIVLVPAIRRPEFGAVAAALVRCSGRRFRWVGWICLGVLIVTGSVNLALRGVGWVEFWRLEFWQGPFGGILVLKLFLVAAILAISALHDFSVGPRASDAWQADPAGAKALQLRRQAVRLGRISLILALAVILLGIMLVRGLPF
jgi:uncharacterized membrane protein